MFRIGMTSRAWLAAWGMLVLIGAAGVAQSAGVVAPLEFNSLGRFTIVQFTDMHYGSTKSNALLEAVIHTMEVVLEAEKPDLVILTGDNVVTHDQPREAWRALVEPMVSRKIPWAAVMGNHDHEGTGMTQEQILTYLETLPGARCVTGPADLGAGGNYILPVLAPGGGEVRAALYCLDSGDYADSNLVKGYAWFRVDQLKWVRDQARALAATHHNVPLPSLAFFHIPFPEYATAQVSGKPVGNKDERVSCAELNSGMFATMLETRAIMGTFVGHDHNNDFASIFHGVCLAYGRKTGPLSYHKLPSGGGRVIVLQEGVRGFTSWIRTSEGGVESRITFPDDFAPDAKKGKSDR